MYSRSSMERIAIQIIKPQDNVIYVFKIITIIIGRKRFYSVGTNTISFQPSTITFQ